MDDVSIYKKLLDLPASGADAQKLLETEVGVDNVDALKVFNMWMLHQNVSHALEMYVDAIRAGKGTVQGVSLGNERDVVDISSIPTVESMMKVLQNLTERIDAETCEAAAGKDGNGMVRVVGLLGRMVTVKFVIVQHYTMAKIIAIKT